MTPEAIPEATPSGREAAASVPVERLHVATRDPERAVEYLRSVHVDSRLRVSGETARFRYTARSARAGELALDSGRATVRTAMDAAPTGHDHCFVSVLAGRFGVDAGREDVRARPGDVLSYPVGRPFRASWDEFTVRVLRLPVPVVAGVAACRYGIAENAFRFEAMTPAAPALGRYFGETVEHLYRCLHDRDTALAHPLVLAAAVETAVTAALVVFPHTGVTLAHLAPVERVPPAAVRRAAAHIEDHAGEALTLTTIAAAAGVGPRGLQVAFRRHFDTTPTAYLRDVRLQRAHRDLREGDPTRGDTVAGIARRWGFTHHGRFAAAYRAAFGRWPGQTLRG